jgi:thymidylate kinase
MTTKKIAVTGIDGTGKTTLIRAIRELYRNQPTLVQAFRAPQYHEDPNCPFGSLSHTIQSLNNIGDQTQNILLKSAALFLSVTLFGDVEKFYEQTYQPRFLFTERQAIVDSLSYTSFYKRLLTGPLDQSKLEPALRQAVGDQAINGLLDWMKVLESRKFPTEREFTFWNLPLIAFDLIDQKPEQLVTDLKRIYHCEIPELLIILQVSPEVLESRITEKTSKTGATRELHEQRGILEMLQKSLIQGANVMKSMYPKMELQFVDSSRQTEAESLKQILALSGLK